VMGRSRYQVELLAAPGLDDARQAEAEDDDEQRTDDRRHVPVVQVGGLLLDPVDQHGVGDEHIAGDPAEQRAAGGDQQRKALQRLQDQRAAIDDQRDADEQAEDEQLDTAVRGRGDGDHVVQAHYRVGDDDGADRRKQRAAALHRLPMAAILRQHQLHGDPQQQNAADDLEVRYAQQEYDEDGENDAQDDGGAGTTDDAPLALPVRQGPAGQ